MRELKPYHITSGKLNLVAYKIYAIIAYLLASKCFIVGAGRDKTFNYSYTVIVSSKHMNKSF